MQLLPSRAIDNALYIFYANQSGRSGNAWFPGLALAIDPNGILIDGYMPDEGMIVTDVSQEALSRARSSSGCTVFETRPEVYGSPQIVRENYNANR